MMIFAAAETPPLITPPRQLPGFSLRRHAVTASPALNRYAHLITALNTIRASAADEIDRAGFSIQMFRHQLRADYF